MPRKPPKPCAHCGKLSDPDSTWSLRACALGRRVNMPLCERCDLKLHEMVLRFMRWPGRAKVMKAYRRKVFT